MTEIHRVHLRDKLSGFNWSRQSLQGIGDAFLRIASPSEESIGGWYVQERIRERVAPFDERAQSVPQQVPYETESPESSLIHWLSQTQIPILLLAGRAGVGKTTLVQHFFRHFLPGHSPDLARRFCYVRIDLMEISAGGSIEAMSAAIDLKIHETLLSRFPDLMAPEILKAVWNTVRPWDTSFHQALKVAVGDAEFERQYLTDIAQRMNDIPTFNTARLRYLSSESLGLVLFLDSIDALSSRDQEAAYMLVRHKASLVGRPGSLRIIVALRQYSYRALMASRMDTGISITETLFLRAPRFDLVLKKRIDEAGGSIEGTVALNLASAPHVEIRLADILQVFVASLSNPATLDGMIALSNSNTRLCFQYVLRCLESEWLFAPKFLEHNFILPWWFVLSGVMVGPNAVYDELQSPVINLFQGGSADRQQGILLRLRLLDLLSIKSEMSLDELGGLLCGAGYNSNEVELAIHAMGGRNLIELADGRVQITPCGDYYRSILSGSLTYLRHVAMDTPVDHDIADKIGPIKIHSADGGARLAVALIKQVARAEREDRLTRRHDHAGDLWSRLYHGSKSPLTERLASSLSDDIKNVMLATGFSGRGDDITKGLIESLQDLDSLRILAQA
jgi:hypothetical protein